MDAEQRAIQKMANDATRGQPCYSHNKEMAWNTFLLERADYIEALSLTEVLGAGLEDWKKRAIMLSLKNTAKELASSISLDDRRNLTYTQLEARLTAIFCPPAESQLLKQNFKQLKQGRREDITRYLSHKESLYKRAYAEAERSMEFLIESTIRGVFNMEVRRKLADARFDANNPLTSFDQLRRCALSSVASERAKMEWGVSESTSMDGLMQTTFVQDKVQGADEVEDMEIGKIEDRSCFNCGEKGHLKADCRKPPRPIGQKKGFYVSPKGHRKGNQSGTYGNGGYNTKGQETDGKLDGRQKKWCYKCDREGHSAGFCFATTTASGGVIPNPGTRRQVNQMEDLEIPLDKLSEDEED